MWFQKNLTVGGETYSERGDPSAYDWTHADLTLDGAWHTLDISGVVPANATVVHLRFRGLSATTGKYLYLCSPNVANGWAKLAMVSQVASLAFESSGHIACEGQQIQYWGSTGWTSIGIVVIGWRS